jgi:hypothetical protein
LLIYGVFHAREGEKPFSLFRINEKMAGMNDRDWARIESEIESLPPGDRDRVPRAVANRLGTAIKHDPEALLRHVEEALHQDVDPV